MVFLKEFIEKVDFEKNKMTISEIIPFYIFKRKSIANIQFYYSL